MADLSAVLRKTIDGLPNATPELRAKVYEKARAAILRQIENANPPLSDEDVTVRRSALEQAIRSTEAHYAAQSAAADLEEPISPPPLRTQPAPPPRPVAAPEAPSAAHPARPAWARKSDGQSTSSSPTADPTRMPRSEPKFERSPALDPGRPLPGESEGWNGKLDNRRVIASTEPAAGFDIPDADTSAPRYSGARNGRASRRSKPLLLGVAAVVALAALGTGGYLYGDRLTALFGSGEGTETAANAPSAGSSSNGGTQPNTNGNVASLPQEGAGTGGAAAPNGAAPSAGEAPKRQFTQRLLADGSEVDDGPGSGASNAFDEGTNIAAATPEPTSPNPPAAGNPTAGAATPQPPAQAAAEPPAATSNAATPAVAQKAMFYEERTAALQGTQQNGNVVWSLVNEPPADGAAPEPAIRAVADVPAEKLKMTMTIRRNLDPTLPASHVIELQFDVPPGFEGGQVANVQRLALKPSEEARGEPLIGVAGKISDGFFIIALNNLDKATETNLALLGKQEWIDIPIAYATGRRALMSIEKGVPGDRIFKEAMEAWAAKT